MLHTLNFFLWFTVIGSMAVRPWFNVYMSDKVSELDMRSNCLYYHAANTIIDYKLPIKPVLEIIEYCLQPLIGISIPEPCSSFNGTKWSFKDLHEKQVSSEELYAWSAPIDVIERYQDYLNNPSTKNARQFFYNCTPPSFDPCCEYSFEWFISFPNIVWNIYQMKRYYGNSQVTYFPCYMHLPSCSSNSSLICLDWRNICDGKLDCENGIDEYDCFSLEIDV